MPLALALYSTTRKDNNKKKNVFYLFPYSSVQWCEVLYKHVEKMIDGIFRQSYWCNGYSCLHRFQEQKNCVKKHHISSSSSSSWLHFVAKMATEIVSLRIYDPKLITGCSLFYLLLDFPVISQSLSTRHNFAIRQNFSTSACVLIYFPFIGIYCPLWYNDTSSTFFVWDVNFTSNLYSKWQSKRERKKKKEREKRIQTHTNPTHD